MAQRTARRRRGLKAAGAALAALFSVALGSTAFLKWSFGAGPWVTARFSFAAFAQDLPRQMRWWLPFVALSALVLPLRALQWQRALRRQVPFAQRYHFVCIGALVHNALPGKLGDLTRAFLLARTQQMPFVRSLGSVALCKLCEFASTLSLAALALVGPVGERLPQFGRGLRIAAVSCVALVGLVVAMAHFAQPMGAWLGESKRLPRLRHLLHEVGEGLGRAKSFRELALVLLFAVPPQALTSLGYGLGLSAQGIPHGLWAGALVIGALSVTQSVPGLPSDVGVYYFVTSWVARSMGASAAAAAAFATLTHLGTVLPQIVLGLISLGIRRIKWAELRQGAALAAEQTHQLTGEAAVPLRA